MTRLLHVHARVRHAAGHRKPVAHGPAFRLTTLMAGLAIAGTTLAVTSPHASAAERDTPRHAASGTARDAVLTAGHAADHTTPKHASSNHAAAAGKPVMHLGSAPPPRPAPGRPNPFAGQEPPSFFPVPEQTVPQAGPPGKDWPQDSMPFGAPPQVTPEDAPPQGVPSPDVAPPGGAPQGTDPQHSAPPEAAPGVPPTDTAPHDLAPAGAAPEGVILPEGMPRGLPDARRLEHGLVKDVLRGNGIRWRSSGGCSDRNVTNCTSFEKMRWGTVKGLVRFAKSSGCDVTVTGGTERGHASGPRSHWNGYKADIALSRCVDRAIKRHPSAGVRGDGAKLYRSPDGVLFALEKDHWDITFR